jgi:hypothetical protein
MRSCILLPALAVLALAALPAHADELTFTLDSSVGYVVNACTLDSCTGYGMATNQNPDPDTCLPPNCVLFTGELIDNDVDPQPDTSPSYLIIGNPYTDASDMVTFDGVLSLDNIEPTYGVLSGDTNPADLQPPTMESGPIFGVDIPAGTPVGVYVDTVNLDIYPTNGNSQFTVSAQVTVVVVPEPSAASSLFAGLAALAAWSGVKCGVKRKWRSSEASR